MTGGAATTASEDSPGWAELVEEIGDDALNALIDGDFAAARDAVRRAIWLPGRALDRLMLGWAGAVLTALGLEDELTGPWAPLQLCRPGTGEVVPADQVPPDEAWFAALVRAMHHADEGRVARLLADVDEEPREYMRRVVAVLTGAAATLREVDRLAADAGATP